MVMRNIVKIDEDKCNGCGDCVNACAEGAIEVVDGKAKLVSDIYCDGLGACLEHCPQNAITVEQREANRFDEEATKAHLAKKKGPPPLQSGFVCPGTIAQNLRKQRTEPATGSRAAAPSRLGQWPVQLKLVSTQAPYFANSDLILVADCVPFAMGDFHDRFLKNRNIVVGCPKLDDSHFYIDKLAEIVRMNALNSLTVIHMEVPCCSGLTYIAKEAIANSGVKLPFEDVTVDLQGNIAKSETIH